MIGRLLFDSILATKLYAPPPQPKVVVRRRLIERLNDGLHRKRKVTLVSAAAGFGKTSLVSQWIAGCGRSTAWLSLDDGDSSPTRFLTYVVAAIRTVDPEIGSGILRTLQSPQPPSIESILTSLVNEISSIPEEFILVLDDYHTVDSSTVDEAVTFLLDHLPPQMHVVIATREDPRIPVSRLRARGQLSELRAADLRFDLDEAAQFLNEMMGLSLTADDVASLESRTEGWVAGLQLAAISLQGHEDAAGFISSLTGSHRFVLDYLLEEVLQRQPESVQTFLLGTSILDRMCGPLCDAVLPDAPATGQEMLEYLERVNLFTVALDNERRWYRYHHLFAELLRQRLQQRDTSNGDVSAPSVAELHIRSSEWLESHGYEIEAFHHAASANDVDRAERLIRGGGIPLFVRGGLAPVLRWLDSLAPSVLDGRPSLWVMYATALTIAGQVSRVEPKLRAAESALARYDEDQMSRDLIGRIADLRALLAVLALDIEQFDTIIEQSRRALEYLSSDAVSRRASTYWKLGLAYQYRGERTDAEQAYSESIAAAEASGNVHVTILATTSLGRIQESNNHLRQAAESYRRVLELVGDPPGPVACEAYTGLARLSYEWNDLERAESFGRKGLELARQVEISSFVTSELFLARLLLANGQVDGALDALARTEREARERRFALRVPEIAAVQVLALLRRGDPDTAAEIARAHEIPISQARVELAVGNIDSALSTLESYRRRLDTKGWPDEFLRTMVLQSIAHYTNRDVDTAVQVLNVALTIAESEGFIRTFIDEGDPMRSLLTTAITHGVESNYARKLIAEFQRETVPSRKASASPADQLDQPLIEPLTQRELEVLNLISQGLSNREISEQLFVAVNTVKGHNRVMFDKLQVRRRTEAVARARELGLI